MIVFHSNIRSIIASLVASICVVGWLQSLVAVVFAEEVDVDLQHRRTYMEKIHRDLQRESFLGFSVCTDANTSIGVLFVDEYDLALFNTDYETSCTCAEEDNTEYLQSLLDLEGPLNDINMFIQDLNDAIPILEISSTYDCINNCEVCFGDEDLCAILETSESRLITGAQLNLTVDDLFTLPTLGPDVLFNDPTYSSEICATYTKGTTGTLCYGLDASRTDDDSTDIIRTCSISLNDEECNSCTISEESNEDEEYPCFLADCTNLPDGTNVASCSEDSIETLNGPFQILGIIGNTLDGFIKGDCDIGELTTPAPITDETTDPPTTEEPVGTVPPTESPTLVDDTLEPTVVATTMEPTVANITSDQPTIGVTTIEPTTMNTTSTTMPTLVATSLAPSLIVTSSPIVTENVTSSDAPTTTAPFTTTNVPTMIPGNMTSDAPTMVNVTTDAPTMLVNVTTGAPTTMATTTAPIIPTTMTPSRIDAITENPTSPPTTNVPTAVTDSPTRSPIMPTTSAPTRSSATSLRSSYILDILSTRSLPYSFVIVFFVLF